MTSKKKRRARALSAKTGMSHQAATNILNANRPPAVVTAAPGIECPECRAVDTLEFDFRVRCSECAYEAQATTAADDFIERVLGTSKYETVKDGGVWPRFECEHCDNDALVDTGRSGNGRFQCFACGESWRRLEQCPKCARLYDDTKNELAVCNECFDAMVAAD